MATIIKKSGRIKGEQNREKIGLNYTLNFGSNQPEKQNT